MPNVVGGTAQIYGGGIGGTTATTNQLYVANSAAWVNLTAFGTSDYFVQPGLLVQGSADVLVVQAPALFVPLQVTKGP